MANMSRYWRFAALYVLICSTISPGQDQRPAQRTQVILRVLLPAEAEFAQLRVDDRPTYQRGTTRLFRTPPLEPGSEYHYTLVATWEPNNYTKITRARKVVVRAGPDIVA